MISASSFPFGKEKKKKYSLEDLTKVIKELTIKLRLKAHADILITDPYLERMRQDITGENPGSMRPS